jgi:hypothetical protein
MVRILMTGMCSVQDRHAFHADTQRVFFRPFPRQVRTRADVLKQFEMAANTGNYLISEAAYRTLEKHEVEYIPFWFLIARLKAPEYFEEIKGRFDFCLFVTANILNSDFDISAEIEVLRALGMPTIFMSIGVQRRSDLANALHRSATDFIEFLKSDQVFSFTRGEFAADFLRSQGVRNVIEACCPSAFHHHENIIAGVQRLKDVGQADLREVWVNGYLSGDGVAAQDVRSLAPIAETIGYVLQDEPLLFGTLDNFADDDVLYDEASGRLIKGPVIPLPMPDGRALDLYAFFSPQEWRLRSAAISLSVGRRFHGNLVTLQAGVPGLFIAHDDRVTEMVSSAGFPFLRPMEWNATQDKVALLRSFTASIDIARFEDTYSRKREHFIRQVQSIIG